MIEQERLFKEHKASFDRLEPNADSWAKVMGLLDAQREVTQPAPKRRYSLVGLAATLLVLISTSIVFFVHSERSSVFDELALYSPEGVEIRLDPSLNKYTLVQFWASGNVLCMEENCYYFLPAYEKYKDQGFEIYSISLDEDKVSWLAGIEENNLPWIHVSDLKGWQSPICVDCNISKLPTSFLLDQNGKIVAKELNAAELDGMLDRLLALN